MNIFIVRHTDYENPNYIYPGRLPFNLSPKGRLHAKKIGHWFKNHGFRRLPIYSSPVARTLQTAEIIAAETDSVVYTDERLTEIWYAWAGKPITFQLGSEIYYRQPDKERPERVLQRAREAFYEKLNRGENCILVTHGDPATYLFHDLRHEPLPPAPWADREHAKLGEVIRFQFADHNQQLQNIQRINV